MDALGTEVSLTMTSDEKDIPRFGRLFLILFSIFCIVSGSAFAREQTQSYAVLVSKEIAKHRYYPQAAYLAQIAGRVSIFLKIGPSGALVSDQIIQSSGSFVLDSAAYHAVAESRFPPPPNGTFNGAVAINFIPLPQTSAYPAHTPVQAYCSAKANQLGLHGEDRFKFQQSCKRQRQMAS
jgi:TonB family protein